MKIEDTTVFDESTLIECRLDEMVNIQPSYTKKSYSQDFDFNAQIDKELARQEEIFQHELNDLIGNPIKPKIGQGPDLHIGFDTEFVSGKTENIVLSLQFYIVGECGSFTKVIYPTGATKQDRPSFYKTISSLVLEAFEKGIIIEWPRDIYICGFFLRVDLPGFKDFSHFKKKIKNVGGKVATLGAKVKVGLDIDVEYNESDHDDVTHLNDFDNVVKKQPIYLNSDDGYIRLLQVKFIDVKTHSDPGARLADIGDLLNLPKLEIPKNHSIERMDLLLKDDPEAFEEYGIRDAEIAVKYFLELLDFAEKHTGKRALNVSASGLATNIFRSQIKEAKIDFNKAFGLKQVRSEYWNSDTNRISAETKTVSNDMFSIVEPFIANCYNGGRNECYAFGPTSIDVWNDFDLAGAYTTGLVDLRHIDYENFKFSCDVNDFKGHVLGFALVEFNFPPDTKYPSLPVRGANNVLFYTLSGLSYCTAPEIEVALNLGCSIKIKHGVLLPWLEGDQRLFEPYVTYIRDLRKSYLKKSLKELYAKLLGNSLYGKTAQGLKEKNVFDTGRLKSVKLPHSELTNAAIAAHTTGFIRAVLSEQIASIPAHRQVVSATTDGFITDATFNELNLSGPMTMRFQALCNRVAPDSNMLELKHKVRQVVAMKTRAQSTALAYEGEEIILAKGGVSPPVPKEEHNAYMVDLFLNRKPGDKTFTRPFTSIRDQWNKDTDVVRNERPITLNLEFDFKRRLFNPTVRSVVDNEHVSLDSTPWKSLDQAERARAIFDGWRRKQCLKTIDNWYDYEDHYQFSVVRDRLRLSGKKSGIRDSGSGTKDVFRRLFLRAYTQELCGLTKSKSNVDLAAWLTQQGYPTTTDELKNAKRAPFIEHVIPRTERMEEFALLLCKNFPNISINNFFEIN